MFSSMKWKFIVVYFLLVFIAMVIVGIFLVGRLEDQQINNITRDMEQRIEAIIGSSTYIASDNWLEYREEIQDTIDEWGLGSNESLFVIYDEDMPTIIASSFKQETNMIGQNALSHKFIDPTLISESFNGERKMSVVEDNNDNSTIRHLAYPVLTSVGRVKGIMYMTYDLNNVVATIDESKTILTSATGLALLITISLGYLIASSITEPIRDVTSKAEEMAGGNFDQFVEVRSDDEIGQLASMFNYLTFKLKETIRDIDSERSKLDTIFNYMAEGVIAVDKNNNLIHANRIAVDILGLTDEILLEDEPIDLKKINLQDIDYNDFEKLEGTEIVSLNNLVYKVKYAPYNIEKDNVGGIIIVFQDITQEHKLDNMRKEFVANVSHELKTPITTIKSYTETLLDNDIDRDVQKRFLTVIDTESDRMTRLVKDLLQLSNIDYKKTNWNLSMVNMEELVKDILDKLELVIKEKNHKTILSIAENLPHIKADKDGMEQVILNIISNSIKYTDEGGNISIDVYKDDGKLHLEFKDNGLGIPKEDQARIFERFYRVEKGRSRDMGGTGLGLSIAKEIIEAHNGEIHLDSTPKVGTEINIILPIV